MAGLGLQGTIVRKCQLTIQRDHAHYIGLLITLFSIVRCCGTVTSILHSGDTRSRVVNAGLIISNDISTAINITWHRHFIPLCVPAAVVK